MTGRGTPAYNDNNLVVGYYRYSSASQNEASIEQQREPVHRWAKAQGLQVVREYADAARSGVTTESRVPVDAARAAHAQAGLGRACGRTTAWAATGSIR